eukprot:jgi/Chlat1/8964/Chrsp94S08277
MATNPLLRRKKRVSFSSSNGSRVTQQGDHIHETPELRIERKAVTLEAQDPSKWKRMRTRVMSATVMVVLFLLCIYGGHVYVSLMVLCIQVVMIHELFTLASSAQRENKLPGFRLLQWYYAAVAFFYVYGRFLTHQLAVTISSDKLLSALFANTLRRHTLYSYLFYITGFVLFILTLKKGQYKYQFGQYAWTHMILFVVFTQSSFTVANIFEGLIWFCLPVSLIIINDISAYFFGVFFGRTPLIKLSPKKTWEGFIGATFGTIIWGFFVSGIMADYQWMTCPRTDLSTQWLHCDPGPLFETQDYPLPAWILALTGRWLPFTVIRVQPVQLHALVLSAFASVIAPFGGFFASGFKRAFKIKDFGDSIPGHGGLTDRMDCQCVMAVFSYIYYQNMVAQSASTVSRLVSKVAALHPHDQLAFYRSLTLYLQKQGLISS